MRAAHVAQSSQRRRPAAAGEQLISPEEAEVARAIEISAEEEETRVRGLRANIPGMPVAPGCVGLSNQGQSCYQNVVLQVLFRCFGLIAAVWGLVGVGRPGHPVPMLNTDVTGVPPTFEWTPQRWFVLQLLLATQHAWRGRVAVVTTRELTQAVVTCWPSFTPSHTECAIEFMEKVLGGLRETASDPNVSDDVSIDSDDDYDDDDDDDDDDGPVLQHDRAGGDEIPLAGFTMKSISDCVVCGGPNETGPTLTFTLRVSRPSTPDVPLHDLLRASHLGRDNPEIDPTTHQFCARCDKRTPAKLSKVINSAPALLILQWGDNHEAACATRQPVDVPVELDLAEYMEAPATVAGGTTLQLRAVLLFTGGTGSSDSSGHWTCIVYDVASSTWIFFNDAHVPVLRGHQFILEPEERGRVVAAVYEQRGAHMGIRCPTLLSSRQENYLPNFVRTGTVYPTNAYADAGKLPIAPRFVPRSGFDTVKEISDNVFQDKNNKDMLPLQTAGQWVSDFVVIRFLGLLQQDKQSRGVQYNGVLAAIIQRGWGTDERHRQRVQRPDGSSYEHVFDLVSTRKHFALVHMQINPPVARFVDSLGQYFHEVHNTYMGAAADFLLQWGAAIGNTLNVILNASLI